MSKIFINGNNLSLEKVYKVAYLKTKVSLAPEAKNKIRKSRQIVDNIVKDNITTYGINTGFGLLSQVQINSEETKQLQKNLILSHSAGVGENLSESIVRAAILIRANTLAKGCSGVRLELIQALLALLNNEIHPIIPSQGSVGASGDLAPLAHMALSLMGEGEVFYKGKKLPAKQALKKAQIQPFILESKEGLALINGTCVAAAISALVLFEAINLAKTADIISSLSLEAMEGARTPFNLMLHNARPHKGQIQTAKNILKLINKSQIMASHKNCFKIQDPYSLRCIPQVHGAYRDILNFAVEKIVIEINSATDNPLIFSDKGKYKVLTGGNFHGAPVAIAMDSLAIGLSYLGSISERRTDKLLSESDKPHGGRPPSGKLPLFLTKKSGLCSGLMLAQYTAASLVSENKVLAHPASVDTIPTSGGFEDHVSMCTISARKCKQILRNIQNILAIELICACQGLDFKKPLKPGEALQRIHKIVRNKIPTLKEDRIISYDIKKALDLIKEGALLEVLKNTNTNLE